MNKTQYDVIVVGGGPAGMMAAYQAGQNGKSVLLIDKNDMLGRKLRITGKGRCNVTNDCDINTFLSNIPKNSKFLYSAINRFSPADTISFFENRGVPLKTERGQRVFPVSDKAIDITNAMIDACKEVNVFCIKDDVKKLLIENDTIVGVKTAKSEYFASNVILCCGGKSYPATGSNGDGYALATLASPLHTIAPIRPSLVALVSGDECCADMQGLSLKNVTLSLFENGKSKPIYTELGEMLFTHFGISGPLVLSASAHIRDFAKKSYYVTVDLKPGLDEKQLDMRILRDFEKFANKDFVNSLDELLPKKMIPIIVMRCKIPPFTKVNSITKEQRLLLLNCIKSFKIEIDDFAPIDEAIITSGGINVSEINPKTMESKFTRGLFFAGEIIDCDGYTGGFNLQIAFSTGFVSGNSII